MCHHLQERVRLSRLSTKWPMPRLGRFESDRALRVTIVAPLIVCGLKPSTVDKSPVQIALIINCLQSRVCDNFDLKLADNLVS
jgi:hypothetical protein